MPNRRIRVLLCKGGLDGHTRPLYILAQELRDAGFEVILTGAYQSPEEVLRQAVQEDPDIIAVSMHTRGHLIFFKALSEFLSEKASLEEFAIAAGGVIAQNDHPALIAMGVDYISSPGDSIKDIVSNLSNIADTAQKGNSADLARLLTRIESDPDAVNIPRIRKGQKRAPVIGLSGAGGAGKSSLLGKLIDFLRRGNKIGVLCMDPLSASGGAVLADRIRFQTYEITTDPNVFIRSSAAREPRHGAGKATPKMIEAMRRADMDFVFLESMGEGQSNSGFGDLVDTFVYVAHPDMGDTMQMLKGGLIETADIIALNKADRPNAAQTARLLRENFSRHARKDGWRVPIIETIASDEKDRERGVEDVWEAVLKHHNFLRRRRDVGTKR